MHYIFPRDKKYKFDNKKVESIANRLIISKESMNDYKNSLPEIYFADHLKKYKDKSKIDKRIKLNDIPLNVYDSRSYDILKKENFEFFIHKRAEKILERLKSLFSEVWEDSVVS